MIPLCAHTSPNYNERSAAAPLSYVILHYTGMDSKDAALARLCTKGTEVSAHYMVDEEGQIYQMVDESLRAWHAGKSYWRGERDINSASIGIELSNPGNVFGHHPYPPAQIDGLCTLLADIAARHPFARDAYWGHADIAPDRKEDPGELFPWEVLAQKGFGIWPDVTADDRVEADDEMVCTMLRTIGYSCFGGDAKEMENAIRAFQRHFHPTDLSGIADDETVARLHATARIVTTLAPRG